MIAHKLIENNRFYHVDEPFSIRIFHGHVD